MKNILFDMDGTLYSFENGKYSGSKLEAEVQGNAKKLLNIIEGNNYLKKFEEIKTNYNEEFSIAFEELYGIKRDDYFNRVWDISPEGLIINNRKVIEVFNFMKSLGNNIYIVSESPMIWIKKVLEFLEIGEFISYIYSGQGEKRKSNGLIYKQIISDLGNDLLMIGDQENSDILMAKENGIQTIFISEKGKKSDIADFNINKLTDLYNII